MPTTTTISTPERNGAAGSSSSVNDASSSPSSREDIAARKAALEEKKNQFHAKNKALPSPSKSRAKKTLSSKMSKMKKSQAIHKPRSSRSTASTMTTVSAKSSFSSLGSANSTSSNSTATSKLAGEAILEEEDQVNQTKKIVDANKTTPQKGNSKERDLSVTPLRTNLSKSGLTINEDEEFGGKHRSPLKKDVLFLPSPRQSSNGKNDVAVELFNPGQKLKHPPPLFRSSTHSLDASNSTVSTWMEDMQDQLQALQKEQLQLKDDHEHHAARWTKRFGQVMGKEDVVTHWGCKWFALLAILHLIFYWLYYVVRGEASQERYRQNLEMGTLQSALSREGLLQVSFYSASYFMICVFDILCTTCFGTRRRVIEECPHTCDRTHVIIAAHRAHESLEKMLPSVLKRFDCSCVHVADNGYRDDKTRAMCEREGIHYHYNAVGNKCNALLVVARKIQSEYPDVDNVVLLDDDTVLNDDFFIRHDLLAREKCAGYCVAIGVSRSPPLNLWEIAIDFEYRSISYSFGARATLSTIPFCHGICAVYKLGLLIEQYEKNWSLPGGLPFGEDGYAGLDFRLAGYTLLQDNANLVLTYCPRRFFPPMFQKGRVQGYGASSLWKQRACRWFLSWPRQMPRELWLVLRYNAHSVLGNIQYRIYFLWWMALNLVSVGWIPYLFYTWLNHESFVLVLVLKGMLTVTGVLVSLTRILFFPAKLRQGIHPLAPLCSPVLGFANAIFKFAGFFMTIYWFIPFVRIEKLEVLDDADDDTRSSVSDENEGGGEEDSLLANDRMGSVVLDQDIEGTLDSPGASHNHLHDEILSGTEEPTETEVFEEDDSWTASIEGIVNRGYEV